MCQLQIGDLRKIPPNPLPSPHIGFKAFRGYFHEQLLTSDALNHIEKNLDRFPLIKFNRTPDHRTLCRFCNWPAQDDTLARLLELINRQLTEKGRKIEKAQVAVINAIIIQTAGGKQRQAIEADKSGAICGETTLGKDQDASCAHYCHE